jgi:hypothetical protein
VVAHGTVVAMWYSGLRWQMWSWQTGGVLLERVTATDRLTASQMVS